MVDVGVEVRGDVRVVREVRDTSRGIGKSEYSIRSRDVLMCSERYADDIPLRFPNTQLPPTRSDASKQSNAKPRSCSALTAAIPDEPAPITQTRGRCRATTVPRS